MLSSTGAVKTFVSITFSAGANQISSITSPVVAKVSFLVVPTFSPTVFTDMLPEGYM